jgi:hypothetical protein
MRPAVRDTVLGLAWPRSSSGTDCTNIAAALDSPTERKVRAVQPETTAVGMFGSGQWTVFGNVIRFELRPDTS